jgi:hypothetical protein
VECENKSDTINYRRNWKHFKIIQKKSGKHNGKSQNQITTENSPIGPCTPIAESANVKLQNVCHGRKKNTCVL